MNKTINKKLILTLNCYFIYLLLGFSKNILGPVLPALIDNYKISLTVAGVLFTFLSTGRFFAVTASTVFIDTVGRKPILVTGNSLVTLGLLGYALSTFWWGHLISILFVGMGIGFAIPGCNALIADLYQEKRGQALNLLHMCFSIGAFLGPLIAGYYLSLDFSWRWIYLTGAVFSSIILIFLLKLEVPGRKSYQDMMKQDLQENYLL
ncbi:MAG: MFS transporter, partial [Halanaerobiaceae bacterium]